MQIGILVYDGFIEGDVLGPLEVLRRAAADGRGLEIRLQRLGSATVTSARGLQLHVPQPLATDRLAVLVVPGAAWLTAGGGGWEDAERRRIGAAISGVLTGGGILAAVATAAAFLASNGDLQGRAATCDRWLRQSLTDAGAEVVNARVVDDGNVVTSAGVTAGLDLGLWLLERLVGPATAQRVERELEYERRGTVWRRPQGGA